jgi:probable O-glycosylation ligase (exosortase A-associated)
MRDIVLTLIVAALLPFILRYPVLGAYTWAWVSMMNPHKLTFGFAQHLPFAQIVAITTLVALFFTRKRYPLPGSGLVAVYVAFLLWMTVTSLFAVAPQAAVLDRWVFVMKIHLMLFVTLLLIRDRKHLELLIWVVTFSVAFYGIKGGVWTVIGGGGGRVWGPPGGMLEGNNELAVALVLLMPFLYYLREVLRSRWARLAMLFFLVATAFAVLGSQSRGALLALLGMAFLLGLKGQRPVRTSLLLIVGVAMAISFMPDAWTERMQTIGSYEADSSAMSRIWTWKTLWAAAIDRPLVGVGFASDNPAVFARYAPTGPEFQAFAGHVFVAHSIYFQVLGEHGFVGLALYLLIGIIAWRTAGRLARSAAGDAELAAWMPLLMRMVQVSLVGFGIGGAFLSLAYLDLPYYVLAYVLLCDAIVRQRIRASATRSTRGALVRTSDSYKLPSA